MNVIQVAYRFFLQPKAMMGWGAVSLAIFALAHFAGWREFTSVISGTFPSNTAPAVALAKAAVYMAAYFATVLLAPILTLAAVIQAVFAKIRSLNLATSL